MNNLPKTPERQTALTDEDYDRFDEQFPALAEQATREAYEQTLKLGLPVTILKENSIVQVTADGTIKELKKIAKPRRHTKQTHFRIK